jgi:exonuclease SbcC
MSQRAELFGTKNPDTEESRLNAWITSAEQAERAASEKFQSLLQELESLKQSLIDLTAKTTERQTLIDQEEVKFIRMLHSAGFQDEQDFTKARLTEERREELNRMAQNLDLRQTDILVRKKDREERLQSELLKQLTETPMEELKLQQQEMGARISGLLLEIGGMVRQLQDNAEARVLFGKKKLLLEAQKAVYERWNSLSELIGSADGKKFRNFAQGLTFELMVAHANRQLVKLTDRYFLVRDVNQPLDLNVIDNYQAGEVRTTKNLSGGESFIVSLALALGLSKMASQRVRVDSLFLDEGFGTLDEDALEMALATLASLRQDGKLIGVISHVPALKDRISTRILVEKISGGKSILKGPGCRGM